ncbi:MAG: 2-C-methyl-D-erythritol 4-phosphate cytidylyltransferase, partial [Fidelibacterota bacterium]
MNLGGEMGVSAIIPGAGESVRFSRHGAPVSPMDRKQFKLLGDQPLIFVSLETFLKSDLIGSVVLVVPEDLVAWMVDAVGERQFEKEVKVVGGGEERQQS